MAKTSRLSGILVVMGISSNRKEGPLIRSGFQAVKTLNHLRWHGHADADSKKKS